MITDDGKVILKRVYKCSPEILWRAWMNPGEIAKWWGNMESAEIEPVAGGKRNFYFQNKNGPHLQAGKYVELIENKLISFTWTPKGTGQETLVKIEFKTISEKETELTLTHEGIEKEETRENHEMGWNYALDCLGDDVGV